MGSLIAFFLSGKIDIAFLVPFAAGNFLYIGAADLIPEIKAGQDLKERFRASPGISIRSGIVTHDTYSWVCLRVLTSCGSCRTNSYKDTAKFCSVRNT
jgi:hypothetical protein